MKYKFCIAGPTEDWNDIQTQLRVKYKDILNI